MTLRATLEAAPEGAVQSGSIRPTLPLFQAATCGSFKYFKLGIFDPGSAGPRFAEWGPDGISTGLASPRMIWVEWLGLLVIDKTVQHYEPRCQKYSR